MARCSGGSAGGLKTPPSSALNALPRELPHLLLPAFGVVLVVHGCVDIGRGVEVRVHEHRDDADQDAVHTDDRAPTLVGGLLLVEPVRARRVQDGDADAPVRVDVRVPQLRFELHLGGAVREVGREREERAEDATLVEAVGRPLEDNAPLEEVAVVVEAHGEAAALVLHELHQLPLEELPCNVSHLGCGPAALTEGTLSHRH
eukprot:CAMPEP_0197875012 /NCGR_PEP_ID=MMETSP1439-20131203/4369_1 /TAXON_ID=66791 /ORGANISM="Gonyaulax spinifera, Strain CCMP409" /LENGTH=201 /DNA_ID=CAMNT_0043494183 /DNA_START=102 /DNA_END=704 /DNA_ORIENTATION=+